LQPQSIKYLQVRTKSGILMEDDSKTLIDQGAITGEEIIVTLMLPL
jgi:hypothetical protein